MPKSQDEILDELTAESERLGLYDWDDAPPTVPDATPWGAGDEWDCEPTTVRVRATVSPLVTGCLMADGGAAILIRGNDWAEPTLVLAGARFRTEPLRSDTEVD